jgi:hypothetical protein
VPESNRTGFLTNLKNRGHRRFIGPDMIEYPASANAICAGLFVEDLPFTECIRESVLGMEDGTPIFGGGSLAEEGRST